MDVRIMPGKMKDTHSDGGLSLFFGLVFSFIRLVCLNCERMYDVIVYEDTLQLTPSDFGTSSA